MSQESPTYYFFCSPKHNPTQSLQQSLSDASLKPSPVINSMVHELGINCCCDFAVVPDKKLLAGSLGPELGNVIVGSLWQAKTDLTTKNHQQPTSEQGQWLADQIVLDDCGNCFHNVAFFLPADVSAVAEQSISQLFVYGTLREGECRQPLVKNLGGVKIDDGKISGRLFDLGDYPGWVNVRKPPNATLTSPDKIKRVSGEIYQFENLAVALRRLDEEEGFEGYADDRNLYNRVLIRPQMGASNGNDIAWVYRYQLSTDRHPEIITGDWLQR